MILSFRLLTFDYIQLNKFWTKSFEQQYDQTKALNQLFKIIGSIYIYSKVNQIYALPIILALGNYYGARVEKK